ncbi:copper resistance CopC/CopD family protein [Micromonospora sp. HM5-17]|uniref:copper resistance CopC/CopD family protein n=1 Tax=Micromonospora sp. HM5-17 TaxID=2487710 RepID=UPI000F4AAAD0|nr:copper resistance protein CopC [Micromonospora sp. HM5-17]ROT26803.1 copper resistance protein CopC [Micromonospora sp. HM5-17]
MANNEVTGQSENGLNLSGRLIEPFEVKHRRLDRPTVVVPPPRTAPPTVLGASPARVVTSPARPTAPLAAQAVLLAGLVALFAGLAVLFAPASPAAAHATVVSTVPQQGAVLGYSPTEVSITFSEPVALLPGRTQVLAPDGTRINAGEPRVQGATLRIPIRVADRPLGTYVVSYRVISADSHPVAGSWTFSVGAASATPPEPATVGVDPVVRVAVSASRYLGYVGLVLALGPAPVLARLWPRRLSRRGAVRLVRIGLGLIAAGALGGLWVQAPYASGAGLLDVSTPELAQVLGSDFGLVLLARLGILLLVAVLLPPLLRGAPARRPAAGVVGGRPRPSSRPWSRARLALLLLLTVAGLATWPLAGHAAAAPVPVASTAADVIHLAAASVWLGGLVVLFGFLLRTAHPRALGVVLSVWSRWAALAVLWLVAGGAVQAVIEIGGLRPLVGTGYGRLVLTKLTLLVALLTVAGYARRSIRRSTADPSGPAGDETAPRLGRLRRAVGVEVALGLVVLGVSAVLVQTAPARSAGIEATAVTSDSFAQTLQSPLYTLQFDIYPVQIGEYNTVHAYVYRPDGTPLPVVQWTVTTALPARGIEPTSVPMLGITPHHAIGSVAFPVPGDWELRFTIRLSEIDQATVRTVVPVR